MTKRHEGKTMLVTGAAGRDRLATTRNPRPRRGAGDAGRYRRRRGCEERADDAQAMPATRVDRPSRRYRRRRAGRRPTPRPRSRRWAGSTASSTMPGSRAISLRPTNTTSPSSTRSCTSICAACSSACAYVLPDMVKRGIGRGGQHRLDRLRARPRGRLRLQRRQARRGRPDPHRGLRSRAEGRAGELRDARRDRDPAAGRHARTDVRRCRGRDEEARRSRHPQPRRPAARSRRRGQLPALGRGELRQRRQVGNRRRRAGDDPERHC